MKITGKYDRIEIPEMFRFKDVKKCFCHILKKEDVDDNILKILDFYDFKPFFIIEPDISISENSSSEISYDTDEEFIKKMNFQFLTLNNQKNLI